jgi:putative transposon-encoded protein
MTSVGVGTASRRRMEIKQSIYIAKVPRNLHHGGHVDPFGTGSRRQCPKDIAGPSHHR